MKITKKVRKNEKGIALIFSLVIVGLLLVMALSFVSSSIFDQRASMNAANSVVARGLAQSTVTRVLAMMEVYGNVTAYSRIDGGDTDFLSLLSTDGVFAYDPAKNSDITWEMVKFADQGNTRILGRVAYIAVPDRLNNDGSDTVSLDGIGLDPAACVKPGVDEGAFAEQRVGASMDEINLRSLNPDVITADVAQKLSYTDAGGVLPLPAMGSWIDFATLFNRVGNVTAAQQTILKSNLMIDPPATKELFAMDTNNDREGNEQKELFNRFQLNKAQSEWNSMTVAKLLAAPKLAGANDPNEGGLAWLRYFGAKWDSDSSSYVYDDSLKATFDITADRRGQIAANLIDYNDSDNTPSSDVAPSSWSDITKDSPSYTGNEKTPYLNEIGCYIQSMVERNEDTVNIHVDGFIAPELVNLYATAFNSPTNVKVWGSYEYTVRFKEKKSAENDDDGEILPPGEEEQPDGEDHPLYNYPAKTFWSIDDENAKVYYYIMSDDNPQVKTEGHISGLVSTNGGGSDIESMKINDNGYVYFIDRDRGSKAKLYRMDPNSFDQDSSTPVPATLIGSTGFDSNSGAALTNFEFLADGRVLGIGHYDGRVYTLDLATGKQTLLTKLYLNGSRFYHTVDGLTQAADGTIYFTRTGSYYDNRHSYKYDKETRLYKFTDLENGTIKEVMRIYGSGKIEALAAHPDGNLYCADDYKWYRVNPIAKTTEVVTQFSADIEGMDFHWPSELIKDGNNNGQTASGGGNNDNGGSIADGKDNPLFSYPVKTFWSIDDESAKMYYYQIDGGNSQVKPEGQITGLQSSSSDIEAMKIHDNGYIYFIDERNSSKLYKVNPNVFDGDPSTPVPATYIGDTGHDGSDKLTNMEFLADGRVIAIGHTDGKLYELNLDTAKTTKLTKLYYKSGNKWKKWKHTVDGMAQAADGTIYFTHTGSYYDNRNSYKKDKETVLYKFVDLAKGRVEKVMNIYGSGKIEAIATHPDGYIYCADDFKWYKVNPIAKTTEVVTLFSADIEGMDFHWPSEVIKEEEGDGGSGGGGSGGGSGGGEPGDPTPEPVWQTVTVTGTFYKTISMNGVSWNDKGYKMSWSNGSKSFINSGDKTITFTTNEGYEFAEAEVINVKVNVARAVVEYAGKNVDIAVLDADILEGEVLVADLAALDFYSDTKCTGKHNCVCARHRFRARNGHGDINDNDESGYGNTERERIRNRCRKRNGKGATCSTATLMQLTNVDDSWKKFYMAGSISAIDPRQNLNTGDWLIKSVVVADESASDLSLNAVKAYEMAGGSVAEANYYGDNSSIYKTKFSPYKAYQANSSKVDYEKDINDPVNVSTNRIRNAAMQSPWELGFIHRGAAWQTINLKAFDGAHAVGFKDGTAIGEYVNGDANILDQIKMTPAVASPYKVDLKVANSAILTALLDRIKVNTSGLDIAGMDSGEIIAELASVVTAIRDDQNITTRASVANLTVDDKKIFSDGVMATQNNDAAQEEIIGKFINLTGTISPISEEGAANPEYFTLLVVAQSIKDIGGTGGDTIKVKQRFSDKTLATIDTQLGTFDVASKDTAGGQEYVYADKITAEHKMKLLIKRDLASGRCQIVDTKYVPSNPGDSSSSDGDGYTDDGTGHSNNGHGNNDDGVDVSNPGQGSGGPNGADDPSGDIDDEGQGGGASPSNPPNDNSGDVTPDFDIVGDVVVANEQVNISIELVGMAYDYDFNDPIPVSAWWSVDGGNSLNALGGEGTNLNPVGGYQQNVWDLGVFDAGTEVSLRIQNQDTLYKDRNTWTESDYIKVHRDGDTVEDISSAFPWQDTLKEYLGDIINEDTGLLSMDPADVLIAAEISYLTGSGADWNDAIFVIHFDAVN